MAGYRGDGAARHVITQTMTSVAAATVKGPFVIPAGGTIISERWTLDSGGGATLEQPEMGRASTWTAGDEDAFTQSSVTADVVTELAALPYTMPGKQFWVRPSPDADTDNVVTLTLIVLVGSGA